VDRHRLEQGVVLEDEADVAPLDGEIVDALAADVDVAGGGHFQAGDHAEHGGLAAAAGAEEGDQLAVLDGQVDVLDGDHVAEALGDVPWRVMLMPGQEGGRDDDSSTARWASGRAGLLPSIRGRF
jgi:hypothetical protein